MLVKYWMDKNFVTIDAGQSIETAEKLLDASGSHLISVIDHGQLVGVVTANDIKRARSQNASYMLPAEVGEWLEEAPVKSIMSLPITVLSSCSVEETAEVLLESDIESVPVMDQEGGLVGVITKSDLFKVLISLTGAKRKGIQFSLQVVDRPGAIREVTELIRKYGGRMACILATYDRAPIGFRYVYIRMFGIDRFRLSALEKDLGRVATILYIKAHREVCQSAA